MAISEELSTTLPCDCMVYLLRVRDSRSTESLLKVVAMSEELSNVLPYDCMVYLRRVRDSRSTEYLLKLWPCQRNYLMFYRMIVWFI